MSRVGCSNAKARKITTASNSLFQHKLQLTSTRTVWPFQWNQWPTLYVMDRTYWSRCYSCNSKTLCQNVTNNLFQLRQCCKYLHSRVMSSIWWPVWNSDYDVLVDRLQLRSGQLPQCRMQARLMPRIILHNAIVAAHTVHRSSEVLTRGISRREDWGLHPPSEGGDLYVCRAKSQQSAKSTATVLRQTSVRRWLMAAQCW